ncbi:unnamed protein product [Aphanomyces euteiches]
MQLLQLILVAGVHVAALREVDRCTTILVGAKVHPRFFYHQAHELGATSGSPMTTHSNACSVCDFRITKVPQKQHARGSLRNVTEFKLVYPRYVGHERGAVDYFEVNLVPGFFNWSHTKPIGQIPQVVTTYGYIEGSTCGANLWAKPVSHGGNALFDITELARLAMERTKTAREAIKLMGSLADQYGYYSGSNWDGEPEYADAGETLTVADTVEGWVFHILQDDSGASAVWVAQRIPDTHITAIGNQFIVHQVNLNDSANLYSVATRSKLWDGKSPFDFTATYTYKQANPAYSTRRQWRIFTLANPSLNLSPNTDPFGTNYPFSVPAAKLLTASDLMSYHRDHYEGTDFDLTQGAAAGPYGTPNRYSVGKQPALGYFERAISIYRVTYSFVSLAHPSDVNAGLVWFGPFAPHATSYMPVYAKSSSIPALTSQGSLLKFAFNSAFWINVLVANYADHYYKHVMPTVLQVQLKVEKSAADALAGIQAKAQSILKTHGEAALVEYLTTSSQAFANATHDAFVALFQDIVTRFHDGSIFGNFTKESMYVRAMGYPLWWLEQVGYFGPKTNGSSTAFFVLATMAVVALSVAVGFWFGRQGAKSKGYVLVK